MRPRPSCAFVLGAGLGTRLRSLTERRPKPLVPLYHKPLITFAFDHLLSSGIDSLIVNTHHCPGAYDQLLGAREGRTSYRGHTVTFRHEPVLLDTGGGIKNIEDLTGSKSFVVYNGDVLADFPLERLIEAHLAGGHLATLALRSCGGPLQIQCNRSTGMVTDIRRTLGGHDDPGFLFTGISILSPEIFSRIPAGIPVSIIPVYLEILRAGGRIGAVVIDEGLWIDLGSREAYMDAHRQFAACSSRPSHTVPGWPLTVHASASIHPEARLEGTVAIGPGVVVGSGAVIKDSIIWENARVESGARLDCCIVRDGCTVGGSHYDEDL